MCKATGIRDTGLMDWRKECKDAPQDGSAMRITLEREREGEGEGEEEEENSTVNTYLIAQ